MISDKTIGIAKERLDYIINIGRVDLYKPIQIAEVLHYSRVDSNASINISDKETYKNPSLRWQKEVTRRLLGKAPSSSANYQHDVWNDNAMPTRLLEVLDAENKRTNGQVERYIYMKFKERQSTVAGIMDVINVAKSESFQVAEVFDLFERKKGIRRSIDKAYEIVTYALFETVVTGLKATVTVRVSPETKAMIQEFSELTYALLRIDADNLEWTQEAHIYRAGVTNAADRGLDMWANFGPAVQVKHLTLKEKLANEIIDQVESDHVVIVCKDAAAKVVEVVLSQIGWGRRVRGIIKESQLVEWYEKCLRGKFAEKLSKPLLERLREGFKQEFPQVAGMIEFFEERGYLEEDPTGLWKAASIST